MFLIFGDYEESLHKHLHLQFFANISSSLWPAFLLAFSFKKKKLLIKLNLIRNFFFISYLGNLCVTQYLQDLLHFILKFLLFQLKCMSLIHSKLILCIWLKKKFNIFAYGCPIVSAPLTEKAILSPQITLASLSKINFP